MSTMTFGYNDQETTVTADVPAVNRALDQWKTGEADWNSLVAQLRAAIG